MSDVPIDPQWPRILAILGHEMRNPISPILGYLRMVLDERAGPLTDKQKFMLKELEKACGRLSKVLAEVSDLHKLETRRIAFNTQTADLHAVMTAAVEQLPPPPDESVEFEVALDPAPAPFGGDPVRLAQVFTSLIYALRRELPLGETLRVEERRPPGLYEFRFGSAQTITAFDDHAGPQQPFDEWREGVGLSLPVARRIVEHHGGHLYAPPEGHKVGARLILPRTIS